MLLSLAASSFQTLAISLYLYANAVELFYLYISNDVNQCFPQAFFHLYRIDSTFSKTLLSKIHTMNDK